jgi:hypothetical protein
MTKWVATLGGEDIVLLLRDLNILDLKKIFTYAKP